MLLIASGDGSMITSCGSAPLYDDHGVLTMNIFDFLLNPDSLDF